MSVNVSHFFEVSGPIHALYIWLGLLEALHESHVVNSAGSSLVVHCADRDFFNHISITPGNHVHP